jgi:GPH family glycoside/pentoside/hexuronide:cation symporter
VFLLVASLAFYAAHSLFAMPLGGLIVEATDDYHERTRLAGVTLAFGFAVQIGSQWIFPLTQLSIWGGTVNGVRWVSTGCALIFIAAGLAPLFLCRERLYHRQVVTQKRMNFIAGLMAAASSPSFMLLLVARGIFSFGFNVVWGGDLKNASVFQAFIGSSYHVSAIITSLLVFPALERSFGKRRTLQLAASVMLLGCVAKFLCYQPKDLWKGFIWLPMIATITNGIANAGVALMANAMLGDIADHDEIKTGLRREGLFSSLLSWVEKAGNSLGTFFTGFILVWIGFVARPAGAAKDAIIPQSETTLTLMKWAYIIPPGVGAVLTILAIWGYRLTQEQVQANKEELARRRAVGSPTGGFPVIPGDPPQKS